MKRPQDIVVSKLSFCIIRRFKRKYLYLDVPLIVIFCMSVYAKDSPNLTVRTACKKNEKVSSLVLVSYGKKSLTIVFLFAFPGV